MILLFELHRYGQSKDDELKDRLTFYPCGKPESDEFDQDRLFRIIGYGECLAVEGFNRLVAPYLSTANLSTANLSTANLSTADLSRANLSHADLSHAYLFSANLRSADLSRASLFSANLRSADLSSANLFSADLSRANLFSANLSSADLSRANLSSADLSRANLRSANLISASLSSADLSSADLFSADLSRANLSRANLSRASLFSADLSSASLFSADLSSADLFSADFRSADFRSANLSSTDLSSANLSKADLSDIKWNRKTRWTNARGLHEAKGVPVELAREPGFAAAVVLSKGIRFAEQAEIRDAIDAYSEAQTIDPTIEVSDDSWNILCKMGSLYGYAADVLFAGEKAISLSPDHKGYQDSRGLARALTGDLDGALTDFQSVLDSNNSSSGLDKARRERWVAALQAGENPFTPKELDALREAEGKTSAQEL